MAEQVGKFLTELPELETPTDGDLMYIVDDETTSKKVTMANLKRVLGGNVTGTVEDASVSFSDGADGIPMEECEVTLVPTQDLHGRSKPWAGGAGKNKLQYDFDTRTEWAESGYNSGITTHVLDNDLTKGATYTLSGYAENGSNSWIRPRIFEYLSGTWVEIEPTSDVIIASGVNTEFSMTFVVPNDGATQYALGVKKGNSGTNIDIYFTGFMLEIGNQATTYEPYSNICPISGHTDVTVTVASTSGGSGDDTTVSLGRTVYGGTLDVTTGELTVDRALVTLSDVNWNYADVNSGVYRFSSGAITNFKVKTARTMNLECSILEENVGGQPWDDGTIYNNGGTSLVIATSQASDTTQLATLISGQTCVYELATPQTFNLTPTQVETLLGQNYVSHDGGGNIKVVYIRDLDITINDLIDRVTALENE